MKFGQLIEYSMRNILLKNYTQSVLDPFLKIKIEYIFE